MPAGTPVSWGGVNLEFGWIWGEGTFFGIDLDFGYSDDYDDYYSGTDAYGNSIGYNNNGNGEGMMIGGGLSIGKAYEFSNQFQQILFGFYFATSNRERR